MSASNSTRAMLVAAAVLVVSFGATAQAGTRTWTGGAGNGSWHTAGNWNPPGAPTSVDDVVIPPNSGTITTNGSVSVKSLTVQDSTPPGGTTITGQDPGDGVSITAEGDIYIGKNNTVSGADGKNNKDGGDVDIESTKGKVTNAGKIKGGKGDEKKRGGDVNVKAKGTVTNSKEGSIEGGEGGSASSSKPGRGGNVTVTGDNVVNDGTETGGAGGQRNGEPKGQGGNATNRAAKQCRNGNKKGGAGEPAGRARAEGEEFLVLAPDDGLRGTTVALESGPDGAIIMLGLEPLAIQADDCVFIDAGGPDNPIDMTGLMPGENVIVAGRSIQIRGHVLLDPGVELADITEPDAVLSIDPCLPPNTPWLDDLDSWPQGLSLHGLEDWKGWDYEPAFTAYVTEAQALSEPYSLDVLGDTDLVHELRGASADRWCFTAWQYIPGDFSSNGSGQFAGSYIVMLNSYVDGGPHNEHDWSVQMQFDSNDGMLKVYYGNGLNTVNRPFVPERWTRVQVAIDLEDDWTRVYYDDQLLAEYQWTGGVLGGGGGARDVAALDLFANGASSVYYDDLRLLPIFEGDINCDQQIDFNDINPFVLMLTDPAAWQAQFPECELFNGDVNNDGVVGFGDINPFIDLLTGP